MITNIDEFVQYVPTARGTHYEDIAPFLEDAKIWVRSTLTGEALADVLATESTKIYDTIVAMKAYETAVPFLDVVQTVNGFAVVNNANVAPASKERVERLLENIRVRLYDTVDILLSQVEKTENYLNLWRNFEHFEEMTELVYWNGRQLMQYCGDYEKVVTRKSNATMSYEGGSAMAMNASRRNIPYLELQRLRGVIAGIQNEEIARQISADYLNELIAKNREKTMSVDEQKTLGKLRMIVGLYLQNEDKKADEQLTRIVNTMEKDLGSYPTYAQSEEYGVKKTTRYENKQEDAAYFFG